MFPRAVRVATIGGVDLRVDPSWALIIVVLVLVYRSSFTAPGRAGVTAVLLALVAALLFGVSVLVHELAHALEGEHRGADVAGITLFALGGATALRGGDRRARDEFAIAAIGPWSNIVLAAVLGLVATGAGALDLAAIAQVAGVVAWLNLGLALFNLVPGAPLDGGRVLRAGVWALTGDKHRATIIAAWAGVALAVLLLATAAWGALGGPGGIWGALWTGAIAAYVLRASLVERQRGRVGRWLASRRAGDLAPRAAHVGPDTSAAQAVALLVDRVGAILVDDGGPVGFVRAKALEDADPTSTVGSLVEPLDPLPRVTADARGDQLADLLDTDQPFVVLTADRGTDGGEPPVWLSSLHAIDGRVQATMRAERS